MRNGVNHASVEQTETIDREARLFAGTIRAISGQDQRTGLRTSVSAVHERDRHLTRVIQWWHEQSFSAVLSRVISEHVLLSHQSQSPFSEMVGVECLGRGEWRVRDVEHVTARLLVTRVAIHPRVVVVDVARTEAVHWFTERHVVIIVGQRNSALITRWIDIHDANLFRAIDVLFINHNLARGECWHHITKLGSTCESKVSILSR